MLLGNTDVKIFLRMFFSEIAQHQRTRCRCINNGQFIIADGLFFQIVGHIFTIAFAAAVNGHLTGFQIKRQRPVELLFVFFRRRIALAFQRMNMNNHRTNTVFNLV